MTGPEIVLAAVFVALWLLPIGLTLTWERRNRDLRGRIERAAAERAGGDRAGGDHGAAERVPRDGRR